MKKLRSLFERARERLVSSVTIFEIFKLSMDREGKDVAELRAAAMLNDFEVVPVDAEIAREGGRLGARLKIPLADALIMATAMRLRLACVTDDPHYTEVKKVWV